MGLPEIHRSIFASIALKGIIRGNWNNFGKNPHDHVLDGYILGIDMVC